MAFWAHVGDPNKQQRKQSDSKNFINKVRNNPVLNKKGGIGTKLKFALLIYKSIYL
jgi:hypothetical protein